jgi:hypothetical protein
MDLLIAIGTLCQVTGSFGAYGAVSYDTASERQLACQKYYVNCFESKAGLTHENRLKQCVLEKK